VKVQAEFTEPRYLHQVRELSGDGVVLADCPHVEVETYTWGVLPAAQRPRTDADLVAGIAAGLRAARRMLDTPLERSS
jgi:hypothetical protein